MAHLPKIALAFEFLSAHPDGARVAPPKSSKFLCAFEHLHQFDRP
jgi:hypothetical protein